MIKIAGIPILADEMTILLELKQQLAINGIDRFANFKRSSHNIQFNCPIHADGQEHKPSCGMSTTDSGKITAGTVHCFTCGYTASLDVMVSHCFGKDDLGYFGREWLVKNFHSISVEERKDIDLDLSRKPKVQEQTFVTEEELDRYRYYHPYMYQRKLTDEIINKFDVGYDSSYTLKSSGDLHKRALRCVTFPVRDLHGRTLFIARRSVDTKFFHYPEGVSKPVYGLYELPDEVEEVIICESIFNALTAWVYGKPAVAMLGLGTGPQYEQLKQLKCRKFITAFDPDPAGAAATIRFKEAMKGSKIVTSYVMPKGKDVNDLSKEEFEALIEVF